MKDLLEKLLETRARETGELRNHVESAEKRSDDTGVWTGEDQAEFERRNGELDRLDNNIRSLKDRVDGERAIDEYRESAEPFLRPEGAGDQRENPRAVEERQIADYFSGRSQAPTLDVSFKGLRVERQGHRNVVRDIESRTGLVEGTSSAGGATFGPSFREVLYQHLIFNSAIRQTRATVLTTASGENLVLPKTTAHPASGTIVSEAGAIGESDPTFGQGTLSAYKYSNLVQISHELEADTAVDLLGYIAKSMGRALGNGAGAHFVTGTGTSQPQGVLVGAGTVAQVAGGTPAASGATFAELLSVYDKIIPPYQISAEWFMGQGALSKIRGLVNTQGTPIYIPTLTGDMPDTLFGKPVIVDPNMPAVATGGTSIAFGDFSPYFIRDVEGVRFERSIDYAFNTDLVTYRAILRTDGRLLDLTGAIANYKGGTA